MDQKSPDREKLRIRQRYTGLTYCIETLITNWKVYRRLRPKEKIRKSNMTIETITDLIHEYMYDRINDSNNSNDGRNVKTRTGKAPKEKMVREFQLRKK